MAGPRAYRTPVSASTAFAGIRRARVRNGRRSVACLVDYLHIPPTSEPSSTTYLTRCRSYEGTHAERHLKVRSPKSALGGLVCPGRSRNPLPRQRIRHYAVPQGAFFPAPQKAEQELAQVARTSNKTAASRRSALSWATEGNKQRLRSSYRSTTTPKQPARPHTARVQLLSRDS